MTKEKTVYLISWHIDYENSIPREVHASKESAEARCKELNALDGDGDISEFRVLEMVVR